jgi:hypothetical protein
MTVPVGFSRVPAVDAALGSGELKVRDCVAPDAHPHHPFR